jgi:hypothetical protein
MVRSFSLSSCVIWWWQVASQLPFWLFGWGRRCFCLAPCLPASVAQAGEVLVEIFYHNIVSPIVLAGATAAGTSAGSMDMALPQSGSQVALRLDPSLEEAVEALSPPH